MPFDVHPLIPKEHITRVVDIRDDGWCGYRAIASHVTGHQNDAVSIKQKMLQQLLDNIDFYEQNLWGGHKCITEEVLNRLRYQQNFGSSCASNFWMDAITELPIAADAFGIPFAVYSTSNNSAPPTLYLPHFSPQSKIRRSPGIIQHVNGNHFVALHVRRSISSITWPSVSHLYLNTCIKAGISDPRYTHWRHLSIAAPPPIEPPAFLSV